MSDIVSDSVFLKCELHRFKFDWIIEDFLNIDCDEDEELEHPIRVEGPTDYAGLTWKVKALLFPRLTRVCPSHNDTYEVIGIAVNVQFTPKEAVLGFDLLYHVDVIGEDGELVFRKNFRKCEQELTLREDFLEDVQKFMQDGNLTLRFDGKIYVRFDPSATKLIAPDSSTVALSTVKNLFETGICHDIVLKANDGAVFKCHKSILSVRSKYFQAMFESGMNETNKGEVDFSLLTNGKELKDLLEFVYLGTASNLSATSTVLLKVSNMIGLCNLRRLCEDALIKELTGDNATEMLELGRLHGARKLEKQALLVMAENISIDY